MKFTRIASMMAATFLAAGTAQAATVYSNLASFNAATTGVTNVNFEGATSYILGSGSYSQSGLTITQTTNNAFLSNGDAPNNFYYYNWGTGSVINAPYLGTLTVTFAAPVTAFGIDLGTFFGLPFTPGVTPGAATTGYGAPLTIGTNQGNFGVDLSSTRNFSFFGLTSDTAFNSFTITGAINQTGASTVFDNVRFGSVAAIPEPATWGMMILGFGIVGASMRRRNVRTAISYT